MAELIKKAYGLTALRISLELAEVGSTVQLQLHGTEDPAEPINFPAMGLEIAHAIEEWRRSRRGPSFSIPDDVVERLRADTQPLRDADDVLWLLFTSPYGNLAAIPWERLLAPLELRLLRIPNFALPPVAAIDTLDVALCISNPDTKKCLNATRVGHRTLDEIVAAAPPRLLVHVFADYDTAPALRRHAEELSTDSRRSIKIYDPRSVEGSMQSPVSIGIEESSPTPTWLRWMQETLSEQSVDIVHFVCPGYFTADQGSVALSVSPNRSIDHGLACFIGASQLSTFMTRLGAWSLHLSSTADDDVWSLGLRMLADQISGMRPGPVTCEDIRMAKPGELEAAYRFLYVSGRDAPRSAALSTYCHPGLLSESPHWEELAESSASSVRQAVEDLTLATGPTLSILEDDSPTPAWLASSQRYLEQRAAELIGPADPLLLVSEKMPVASAATWFSDYSPDGEYEQPEDVSVVKRATRKGAADALQFISGLIEEHETSGGDQ